MARSTRLKGQCLEQSRDVCTGIVEISVRTTSVQDSVRIWKAILILVNCYVTLGRTYGYCTVVLGTCEAPWVMHSRKFYFSSSCSRNRFISLKHAYVARGKKEWSRRIDDRFLQTSNIPAAMNILMPAKSPRNFQPARVGPFLAANSTGFSISRGHGIEMLRIIGNNCVLANHSKNSVLVTAIPFFRTNNSRFRCIFSNGKLN